MNPNLLAGIGLTRLRVYEQRPAPDGLASGCAHVHGCTDEAYYVVAGSGAIELHDVQRGFRRIPLVRGDYVQFPPETLHRSVSTGGLEVLAVMGNAGLPEHGDARIYFGEAVDNDPDAYARLAALPRVGGLEGALERRDASVRAYLDLMQLWMTDRDAYRAELERFIVCHKRAIAPLAETFVRILREGPQRWNERGVDRVRGQTGSERLESLKASPRQATTTLGMCGILEPILSLDAV